ncbi:hypothetical protein M409DRAFT_66754 [Zasmidium cellare ATCC 36951]|uniref:SnoaL-like domain-containing protein n=1 Tax=Zasmidium cellare ATCC 36951 TaxID=1080233 RepID=A0A6A6CJC5_ZASCE|nr:uncharacterized protein M409DRAFT_66754 [Zasmidium cellare ATCC 36951]KAF2166288.1 hypothetical protein M409DRAFT_66754 [Zasmidium cellare ATCC 36951]
MSRSIPPSNSTTPSTQSTESDSPSSVHPPPCQPSKEDTASYLERVSVGGVLAVNDRDYDYSNGELYKAVSSSFRAHFENFPHPLTLAEHSAILHQTIERFPDYHVEVQSVSPEVDKRNGTAIVYMETEVTGAPPGTRMALMNEFRWRRDGGAWQCWLHHGMKGMSDFH